MAIRLRQDGSIVCAAKFPVEDGDVYLDDGIHYMLSVETHALVTDTQHLEHGLWWWANRVPEGVTPDEWWRSA